MNIIALCPTFRHPDLLANSIAMWERQDYPADKRFLIILDDGGNFNYQEGPNWVIIPSAHRLPSLPIKYNAMLDIAKISEKECDAYLVWEDDDIYLKNYVSQHAETLKLHELSKPERVMTDCGPDQTLKEEGSGGRFHSTLGFRKELIERVGGWPLTKRADFDLQFIDILQRTAKSIGEWKDVGQIPFVYCWHTGAAHGQWTMKNPEDETWYDRADEVYKDRRVIGTINPSLNPRTIGFLGKLESE